MSLFTFILVIRSYFIPSSLKKVSFSLRWLLKDTFTARLPLLFLKLPALLSVSVHCSSKFMSFSSSVASRRISAAVANIFQRLPASLKWASQPGIRIHNGIFWCNQVYRYSLRCSRDNTANLGSQIRSFYTNCRHYALTCCTSHRVQLELHQISFFRKMSRLQCIDDITLFQDCYYHYYYYYHSDLYRKITEIICDFRLDHRSLTFRTNL